MATIIYQQWYNKITVFFTVNHYLFNKNAEKHTHFLGKWLFILSFAALEYFTY